jgi:hypothetical protein
MMHILSIIFYSIVGIIAFILLAYLLYSPSTDWDDMDNPYRDDCF